MEIYQMIVTVCAGALTIGALGLAITKIVNAISKKCPCRPVLALQAQNEEYKGYFSKDKEAIGILKKDVELLQSNVDGMGNLLEEIRGDVKEILKSGVFK